MIQNMLDQDPNPKATLAGLVSQHPLGRLAAPDDVANVVIYFTSDEASFVTRTVPPVDGGSAAA